MTDIYYNNIAKARGKTDLSQEKISQMLGVARSTYQSWESGRIPVPSNKLRELSDILGCSCDYLLGLEVTPTYITEKTGLAHDTVLALMEMEKQANVHRKINSIARRSTLPNKNVVVDVINFLVQNEHEMELLTFISKYFNLSKNFRFKNGDTHLAFLGDGDTPTVAMTSADFVQGAFVSLITDKLSKCRDAYQKRKNKK